MIGRQESGRVANSNALLQLDTLIYPLTVLGIT